MIPKRDRLHRARQLNIIHPHWGRRKINAQLREEFGTGLRDAVVDRITSHTRAMREAGISPEIKEPKPKKYMLPRLMKRYGFLPLEIYGVEGSPAKPLGEIMPDAHHPLFRRTMERILTNRRDMYFAFLRRAEWEGWSRAKTATRWRRRILNYYRKGSFPVIGKHAPGKGTFVTPDGKPSPWALYRAWEALIIKRDPLGGEGWGTPRPASHKRPPPERPVSKSSIRESIAQKRRWLSELERTIARDREEGKPIKARLNQRQRLINTIQRLERGLV